MNKGYCDVTVRNRRVHFRPEGRRSLGLGPKDGWRGGMGGLVLQDLPYIRNTVIFILYVIWWQSSPKLQSGMHRFGDKYGD